MLLASLNVAVHLPKSDRYRMGKGAKTRAAAVIHEETITTRVILKKSIIFIGPNTSLLKVKN